ANPSATETPMRSPIFLFSSPLDARDLHSFPTRRSSDLPAFPQSPYLPQLVGGNSFVTIWDRVGSEPRTWMRPGLFLWRLRWRRGDRKSTRLNSSHVAISYAVYCLKTKSEPVAFQQSAH